jgi:hypothetical protein
VLSFSPLVGVKPVEADELGLGESRAAPSRPAARRSDRLARVAGAEFSFVAGLEPSSSSGAGSDRDGDGL